MVRQYYVTQITELSKQELQSIFQAATPPVCLLGGWAVHLHVNPGFQQEHGREYIGSRDIDIGINVKPEWNSEELRNSPVDETLASIESLGYEKSRFGFVQNFLLDTGERITEDEAQDYPMHEVFQVYVDIIPDTEGLETFQEIYGFKPPAEPLLKHVFQDSDGKKLSQHVNWSTRDGIQIVPPELLAAMKIRSLPDRDKSHKQVKDAADLHALLWYTKDYQEIKEKTLEYVTDSDLNSLQEAVNEELFQNAAQLLQINTEIISNSIQQLF
jgi:hypothetical protein